MIEGSDIFVLGLFFLYMVVYGAAGLLGIFFLTIALVAFACTGN